MGKNILLCTTQGTRLSQEISDSLKKIFQQDFIVKPNTEKPELHRYYEQRRQSLHRAFLFMMKAWPPKGVTATELNNYLNWCKLESEFAHNSSLEEYQAALAHYSRLLVEAI